MLVITLGEPVKEFTYAFKDKNGKALTTPKKYTPKEFYQEIVGGPLKKGLENIRSRKLPPMPM